MRAPSEGSRLVCGLVALGLGLVLSASGPVWGDPPVGERGDLCEDGLGGFGEPAITGPQAIGWWRGEWDAVKQLDPGETPMRLDRICVCLHSGDYEPTAYDFNLVAYAADGPDGKPGTRLLSLPARAVLDRYTHEFFGFDLAGGGSITSSIVYVGVHSVTNGPQDPRALFICQYPQGTGAAPTYYRLPEWSGETWNPLYYSQVGELAQIGIRASFSEAAGGSTARCVSTGTTGCLGSGRFKIEADYSAGAGQAGAARVGALGSDTAYLTFFRDGNVEALVKVLNGCNINGHYWVFLGGLTNVEVEVRVTDTVTGHAKTYSSPRGPAFLPVQDTRALACQ